jgi:hypothetical protein
LSEILGIEARLLDKTVRELHFVRKIWPPEYIY